MRVTFVLPKLGHRPSGGFLVVYRYANELTARGHQVTIVHSRGVRTGAGVAEHLKAASWTARKAVRYRGHPRWFALDPRVNVVFKRDLSERHLPDADAVFATACQTADIVAGYGAAKGRKLYLVQHYEDFVCGKAGVDTTWRLPMTKIVVSKWLLEIGEELGVAESCVHIPNGVENEVFRVTYPIESRTATRIGILAHDWPSKGMEYGVAALNKLRERVPELAAVAFGAGGRPPTLPDWVEYVENPGRDELVAIYNSLGIFMHTSVTEGWGLTGAEALACGCALVASDSGGVRDYAIDRVTALVVPTRDPDALAAGVEDLISDRNQRIRLAAEGGKLVRGFTWDRAGAELERVITGTARVSAEVSATA